MYEEEVMFSYDNDLIKDELSKPTIFKDESKLSIDYVPPYLPHRENEIRLLTRMFRETIKNPGLVSTKVVITGSVGTGKTAIAKYFGQKVESITRYGKNKIKYIHINCRLNRSEFSILKQILKYFIPSLPDRGLSPEELYQILLSTLEKEDLYIILTLDEVDFALKFTGPDLIYRLTRVGDSELNPKQRLSLILIVRNIAFKGLLDLSTLSTLQHNFISLKGYSANQLYDILSMRVKGAFYEGTYSEEALRIAADLASAWGDARYALELVWRAGKLAEMDGSLFLTPDHVRKIHAELTPSFRKEDIYTLTLHQKLMLLALSRVLRRSNTAYATTGALKEAYTLVCEEYHKKPVKHTQLWKYLKDLENLGIVSLKLSSTGIKGKTTLISLEDIPIEILEQELIKILERDTL